MTDDLDPEVKSASAYILNHAHGYEAVLTMARNVDQLGKLDTLLKERQGSVDAATAMLEKATKATEAKAAELAEAQDKITAATERAATIVADAKTNAAEIVAEATRDRSSQIVGANADAAAIIAKTVADNTQAEIDLADRRKTLQQLLDMQAEAEARADAAEKRVADAKAYLAALAKS